VNRVPRAGLVLLSYHSPSSLLCFLHGVSSLAHRARVRATFPLSLPKAFGFCKGVTASAGEQARAHSGFRRQRGEGVQNEHTVAEIDASAQAADHCRIDPAKTESHRTNVGATQQQLNN